MKLNIQTQVAVFFLTLFTWTANAQSSLPSIAVSRPQTSGLTTKSISAEKMLRMEIIKLQKYIVFDEFDMADVISKDSTFLNDCQSKSCLIRMGKSLNVDFVISGSYDKLGRKIVIQLKLVDVKQEKVIKTTMMEFDDQEHELQRMTETIIKDMHDISMPALVTDKLNFQNDIITSNEVGKVSNAGPRIGYAFMTGSLNEFALRSERTGGLDIFPGVSMIGYQFEGQYVGTEKFSALVEVIINVSGMEQGQFIPTLNLMNGFRFGKAGWEFAFGPGIGIKKVSNGFFDNNGLFGDKDAYISENDWNQYAANAYSGDSTYINAFGSFVAPAATEFDANYINEEHGDTRGDLKLSTHFVFAIGRTFHAGALNIPVNLFYTAKKKGGLVGLNVGFNVIKSKTKLTTNQSKSNRVIL
jgi:TolB-like protein